MSMLWNCWLSHSWNSFCCALSRFCRTFFLLVHKARHVLFANQPLFWLKVWLLPSLISVCPICFVLVVLSLSLYRSLWLPEYLLAHQISLSIININRRRCWIINHEAQSALFQFCHHVESMTIDWYHKVISLDHPGLLVMKFCFHFWYFTKSLLHKKTPHWRKKTIIVFVRQCGCKNEQMAQNCTLEWTLWLIHTLAWATLMSYWKCAFIGFSSRNTTVLLTCSFISTVTLLVLLHYFVSTYWLILTCEAIWSLWAFSVNIFFDAVFTTTWKPVIVFKDSWCCFVKHDIIPLRISWSTLLRCRIMLKNQYH